MLSGLKKLPALTMPRRHAVVAADLVLPSNIAPGEELPLVVIACVRTLAWLAIIAAAGRREPREARINSLSSGQASR